MAEPERKALSLDALVTNGITVGGRAVDRIKYRIRGLGWSTIALPIGEFVDELGEPNDDSELSPTQIRIREVLKRSPEPMTRRAIANKLKRESIGGTFSQYVADLVSRGLVFEYGGELADDVKKFKTA